MLVLLVSAHHDKHWAVAASNFICQVTRGMYVKSRLASESKPFIARGWQASVLYSEHGNATAAVVECFYTPKKQTPPFRTALSLSKEPPFSDDCSRGQLTGQSNDWRMTPQKSHCQNTRNETSDLLCPHHVVVPGSPFNPAGGLLNT